MVAPARHPITIAVVGLGETGLAIVEQARERTGVRIACLCDMDAERLRRTCDAFGAEPYTDFRSLFQEARRHAVDVALLSLPIHQCADALLTAASCGMAAATCPPFARSVVEGKRIVDAFAAAGAQCWSPRPWQGVESAESVAQLAASPGLLLSCRADVVLNDPVAGWRGDRARSGGGVLLHGAYHAVDFLVAMMGLPLSVHAEMTYSTTPGAPRTHDTEDAAILSLRLPRELIATLWVARCPGARPVCTVTVATSRGLVEGGLFPRDAGDGGGERAPDPAPGISARGSAPPPDEGPLSSDAQRRAAAVAGAIKVMDMLQGELGAMPAPADQHLYALAVIDAAYLSVKTGAGESPRSMLEALSSSGV